MTNPLRTTGKVLSYATPRGLGGVAPVLRSGPYLVIDQEAVLPQRCIRCNAPTAWEPERVLIQSMESWRLELGRPRYEGVYRHPRDNYVIVHVSYCDRHRRARWRAKSFTAASLVLAIMLFCVFLALSNEQAKGSLICLMLALVVSSIWLMSRTRGLRFSHKENRYTYLRGACYAFLDFFEGIER